MFFRITPSIIVKAAAPRVNLRFPYDYPSIMLSVYAVNKEEAALLSGCSLFFSFFLYFLEDCLHLYWSAGKPCMGRLGR
jgi:hypothetical protein